MEGRIQWHEVGKPFILREGEIYSDCGLAILALVGLVET